MKRGEKRSEPPEKAKAIFSVVNLLPPDLKLIDIDEIYHLLIYEDPKVSTAKLDKAAEEPKLLELNRDENRIELIEKYLEIGLGRGSYLLPALETCLVGLPDAFVEFVDVPQKSDLEGLYNQCDIPLFKSYETFLDAFKRVPRIADQYHVLAVIKASRRYKRARSWHTRLYEVAKFVESFIADEKQPTGFGPPTATVFRINNIAVIAGRLDFEPDDFTDAFHGIPIKRIRLCKNCGHVFWAKRDDMRGCSVSCAKILRTRKWREKITPEQKQKYKVNRYYKEAKKGEK